MLSDLFSTILLQWWMAVLYMVKVYVKVVPLAESRDFRTRISLRQMSLLIFFFLNRAVDFNIPFLNILFFFRKHKLFKFAHNNRIILEKKSGLLDIFIEPQHKSLLSNDVL